MIVENYTDHDIAPFTKKCALFPLPLVSEIKVLTIKEAPEKVVVLLRSDVIPQAGYRAEIPISLWRGICTDPDFFRTFARKVTEEFLTLQTN